MPSLTIILPILNNVTHCLHVWPLWTEERSGELSCCFVFIWARRGWRPRLSGGDIHLIPLPQWRLQNNVQIIKDKGWIVIPGNTRPAEILPTPGTWPGQQSYQPFVCIHYPHAIHIYNTSTHLYIYISTHLHNYISTYLSAKCCIIDVVELNLLSIYQHKQKHLDISSQENMTS